MRHPSHEPGYYQYRMSHIEANKVRTGNTGELKCFCGKTALYRHITLGACKEHKHLLDEKIKADRINVDKAYALAGGEQHRLRSMYDTELLGRQSLKSVRKRKK